MVAVNIWRLTIATIVAQMVIGLTIVPQLIEAPSVAFETKAGVFTLALLVMGNALQIWSIGLLYRREFDLYILSLTCWFGLHAFDSAAKEPNPSATAIGLVTLLGIVLYGLQVSTLARALVRAGKKGIIIS